MNRRTTQKLSLAGGVAALATAFTAAALADNHETGPAFDPTRPAIVDDVLNPTTDISDFTAREPSARVVLKQCLDGPDSCSEVTYPIWQLESVFGPIQEDMVITLDPANE